MRNLERQIAALLRKAATQIARGAAEKLKVDEARAREWLGPRRFSHEVRKRTSEPGVATGLAWTPAGGEILFIEAGAYEGKGRLKLTGQLSEVMQESAQTAFSWVRSRAVSLQLDPGWFAAHDVHIHVPAGAVPKDGPSAGVAMATAIVSLVTGRPVANDVGHDGRGDAHGAGAADRRRPREGARGATRGAEARDPAARERVRPRGAAGGRARGDGVRPRRRAAARSSPRRWTGRRPLACAARRGPSAAPRSGARRPDKRNERVSSSQASMSASSSSTTMRHVSWYSRRPLRRKYDTVLHGQPVSAVVDEVPPPPTAVERRRAAPDDERASTRAAPRGVRRRR